VDCTQPLMRPPASAGPEGGGTIVPEKPVLSGAKGQRRRVPEAGSIKRLPFASHGPRRAAVVAVTNGRLDLSTRERIFYGEFDGRRRKRVPVKIIGE
jgi:hypothetical protein